VPSPRPHTPANAPSRQEKAAIGFAHGNTEGPVQALPQDDNTDPAGLKLAGARWVSVYDRLTSAIKVRHYSPHTLQAYRMWTQKFQTWTQSKDPLLVSMEDVRGFLSFLAVHRKVAASSQNQAFNALLFLFKQVLEKEFEKVEGVVRAKRKLYIPVVLSREEVDRGLISLMILMIWWPSCCMGAVCVSSSA
jgi:hypothetical protein